MDFRNPARLAAAVLAAATLAGCASVGGVGPGSSPEAKRAAVQARAEVRGAALVKGDLDRAYDMMSEGSKAVISRTDFARRMSVVAFAAHRIESVDCEAERCLVKARVTYNHRVMKGVTTPLTEVWVFERGQPVFVFPAG